MKKNIFFESASNIDVDYLKMMVCYFSKPRRGEKFPSWEEAREQWEVVGMFNTTNRIYCICGKTHNIKYQFVIRNIENGTYLYPVGRVCALNFKISEEFKENVDILFKKDSDVIEADKSCTKLKLRLIETIKNIINGKEDEDVFIKYALEKKTKNSLLNKTIINEMYDANIINELELKKLEFLKEDTNDDTKESYKDIFKKYIYKVNKNNKDNFESAYNDCIKNIFGDKDTISDEITIDNEDCCETLIDFVDKNISDLNSGEILKIILILKNCFNVLKVQLESIMNSNNTVLPKFYPNQKMKADVESYAQNAIQAND